MNGAAEKFLEDKFSFEQTKQGNATVVFIKGFIDEDAQFGEIGQIEGAFIFNFKDLTGINSCGIRNWVNFMKELKDREVSYEECPPALVRQMNMVPSVVGNAKVLSVYVPYVCDACDHEAEILVKAEKFSGATVNVEDVVECDSCKKKEMVIDGHPDQYFTFRK